MSTLPSLTGRGRGGGQGRGRGRGAMALQDLDFTTEFAQDRKFAGDTGKDGSVICRPKPQHPHQKVKVKLSGEQPMVKQNDEGTSYKKGGRVKHTGKAKLHKDEVVLPVSVVKQLAKLMK